MKLLKIDKTLGDGRVVKYHRVTEMSFDANTPAVMLLLVGSWEDALQATKDTRPDGTFAISAPNDPELHGGLLEHILTLPDWQSGELVDAPTT